MGSQKIVIVEEAITLERAIEKRSNEENYS